MINNFIDKVCSQALVYSYSYIQYQMFANLHGFSSTMQLQESQARPVLNEIYGTIELRNHQFRILIKEYSEQHVMTMFYCVFWLANTLGVATFLGGYLAGSDSLPILAASLLGILGMNAYALLKRNQMQSIYIFSCLNLVFFTTGCLILQAIHQPYLFIGCCCYAGIEILGSFFLMENKGKILLKVLILLQMTLICFKVDERISLGWNEIFFGLGITFIFFIAIALFILIYSLVLSRCYRQQFFNIKKYGLIYLSLFLLTLASIIAIPLSWSIFSPSLLIPTCISLAFLILQTAFTWHYEQQITLFLCDNVQSAAAVDLKIEINPIPKDILIQSLFMLSENWVIKQFSTEIPEENLANKQQCIVCMCEPSQVVWMPCGHLTVCKGCAESLFNTKIVNCVLCKKKPEEIYRIKIEERPETSINQAGKVITNVVEVQSAQLLPKTTKILKANQILIEEGFKIVYNSSG